MDFKSGGSGKSASGRSHNVNPSQLPASPENRDIDTEIYHVGSGVKPPRAIFTPEPPYSNAARYEKFQGVVVVSITIDRTGNVSKVSLVTPLGLGLDQNAIAAVKKWSFEPAMLEGKPVAVEMNIEVAFNLY